MSVQNGAGFFHMETYGRKPGRNGKKQSIRGIANEAERKPGACSHVESPEEPILVFGVMPSEVVRQAEEIASIAKDSIGRKLRSDAQLMVGGIASLPISPSELNDDGVYEYLQDFISLNTKYLSEKFGDDFKSMVLHLDEEKIHLHYYLLPSIDDSGRFNIGSVHPGILARDTCGSKKAKDKMSAYKKAMRELQDDYYENVSKHLSLTRHGPRRRRLTRKQWKIEKDAAKRLSESLSLKKSIDEEAIVLNKVKKALDTKEDQIEFRERVVDNRDKLVNVKIGKAKSILENAKLEKQDFIKLKAKPDTLLGRMRNKIAQLTRKVKSLMSQVSELEDANLHLSNELTQLEAENKKLLKINAEFARQSKIKDKGLKELRTENIHILSMVAKGKHKQVIDDYDINPGMYYN